MNVTIIMVISPRSRPDSILHRHHHPLNSVIHKEGSARSEFGNVFRVVPEAYSLRQSEVMLRPDARNRIAGISQVVVTPL